MDNPQAEQFVSTLQEANPEDYLRVRTDKRVYVADVLANEPELRSRKNRNVFCRDEENGMWLVVASRTRKNRGAASMHFSVLSMETRMELEGFQVNIQISAGNTERLEYIQRIPQAFEKTIPCPVEDCDHHVAKGFPSRFADHYRNAHHPDDSRAAAEHVDALLFDVDDRLADILIGLRDFYEREADSDGGSPFEN